MKQFKSAGQAQRFLSAHDQINNLFHLRRDHVLLRSTEPPGTKRSRSGRNLHHGLAINLNRQSRSPAPR
jgi:hypothetical protein